ncbi:MAG: superoxide dismutase [Deltaproteobacteria bacterium]|nr:superoxide dismutase [Deltaproteobacteria bacterium]
MTLTMKCTLLASLTIMVAALTVAASAAPAAYSSKDFSRLKGMPGFSDQALDLHFTLYQGYVKNTNVLLENLSKIAANTPAYAEMKRRLGWEYNGMRLHELYFGNLGGDGNIPPNSRIAKRLVEQFGSLKAWSDDFKATGAMRGIGWVVLYEDPATGRLINTWINEHDVGHLSGGRPLLVMDVFEHAFIPDYGLKRAEYIEAFFKNIDWPAVESRLGQ